MGSSLLISIVLAVLARTAKSAGPGRWGEKITFPLVPAAAAVVPQTGKLLVWSSSYTDRFSPSGTGLTYTAEYDPVTKTVTRYSVDNTQHDMFCPGSSYTFSGELVVTGGNSVRKTSIYSGGTWRPARDMVLGRGYQSTATLSDGRVFNIGGSWSGGQGGKDAEVYNGTSWSRLSGCPVQPMLTKDPGGVYRSDNHAMLFGWKSGSVFQAGPSVAMNWYGTSGSGKVLGAGNCGTDTDAMCGISVMYDAPAGKILVVGGATAYEGAYATTNANIVTIGEPFQAASVQSISPMAYRRTFGNGVALPDGKVLILGGQELGKPFSDATSTQVPEIWDPQTRTFTQLAKEGTPRTYHSVALLMPDGTVFSGGGGLCGDCGASNHFDGQIFTPPYLFQADGTTLARRPEITGVSATSLALGATFTVTLSGTAPNTSPAFSLVRIASVTHTVNTDQRRVPLTGTLSTGTTWSLTLPRDAGIALPGYWFLFVLVDGVPSVSRTILIRP